MRNFNNTTEKKATRRTRLVAWLMIAVLILQIFSVLAFAANGGEPIFSLPTTNTDKGGTVSGIGKLESDAISAQLKKDFIGSLNKDLVKRIEDLELRGAVGAIISFSDESLISSFTSSQYADRMTYGEFRTSAAAEKIRERLAENQEGVISALRSAGLITEVKYNYYNIMDGAYVRTTYENIEKLCSFEGVERVIISNTYEPMTAVDNPVDVYDTGIFNSSNISYTGEGTIVAILDSGCDYSHSAFTTHTVVNPLYDRDKIAEKLPSTVAYSIDPTIEVREVYYGNITGGKVAFGYDYADKDTDVMPFTSSHGTHVAGIIGGMDDTITGVAIDTQLAIMKVFSDYDAGAEDGDILAALEDSIILGVDAINMSLGSSCGFTREVDDEYKNELYDRIEEAGISLVVAASNDYSSGFGSEESNTNKTTNPDSATVGAPSTYHAALAVASINGRKENYILVNGDTEVFFNEAYNMATDEYSFFEMLGLDKDNTTAEFEYVTIPGYGYSINYSGVDIEGKIALVKRGDITFEEKVQFAYEAGAAGIIIYNNIFGEISMTVGNDLKIPVVSISKDDGDAMAARSKGTIVVDFGNEAGPFMSDFSSWGPTPSLELKPEITAHGGNILSAIAGGEYEEQSGTSMAAPNMCGITVLIRQYVKENFKNLTVTEQRDLVNQLCMSTATIALDKNGNPYSPRKQGAGIADIAKATTTPAYLYVEGIGKTKIELFDDPDRLGVYELPVKLKNISAEPQSYSLGSIIMTESISTSEPEYVAEMAYLLSAATEYTVTGATREGDVITVAAGETASIVAKITLSDADKAYINSTFKNGMYVEGFLTLESTAENGIDLNAPFLGFFGDWGEAPIFDLDYYEVETEAHNDAIDDDEKIKADYYATTPTGTYYYDYILPLGSYVYEMDESLYSAIPATEEHAAISYFSDCISGVYGVFAGLLRGAKEMSISVVDTSTGKIVWSKVQYNCYKAHYNGSPYPYVSSFDLPIANYKTGSVLGSNNTRFEVTMSAKLDWNGEERNSSDTYTFSFYIDYEAPSVVDATFRTEYDKSREENRYYADIMVYDNHYAMSIRPIIAYDLVEDGETKKTYASLTEYPIPIYQENRGEASKVTIEITDYIDIIADSALPEGLTVYIDDFAMNSGVCYIPFPETESDDLSFIDPDVLNPEIDLDINETLDLTTLLVHKDTTVPVETDYLKTLTWTSSDESVVAISGGKIEAKKAGSAVISVTGSSWKTDSDVPISKSLVVKVSTTEVDNPDSAKKVPIEALDFVSYNTIFAFNSDIDYSEIGVTDSINYFGGNNSISFYPSEQVKLNYKLDPWNIDPSRYTLTWSSSNPKVATVDENGVVTAESEGFARISLQIKIDDRVSLLAARCSVTVKSEFIIENRTLVAYKGKGGDVVIPDDEGIMSIGAFAFCHYDLDNEKEVEKDENGFYDIDEKKEPLGNDTVTSVVIPDGVETIDKYAFYNCRKLKSVTLPESCKTINERAFANCSILEEANLESVSVIHNYAFYKCESLNGGNDGIDLSGVYAVGDYAFAGARFDSLTLTNLSLTGVGAFSDCTKLTSVTLGEKTRISNSMFENTPVTDIVIYSDIVGDKAFAGCTKLTSVEFKNDLTYLGSEAFSGCKLLNSVTFDKGCEKIAALAFYECAALESFTLPNCDVVISDGAFGRSGIETLIFGKKTHITEGGIGILEGVDSLEVELGGSDYYVLADGAVYTKDGTCLVMLLPDAAVTEFTVPAAVTYIMDGAFSSNKYIKSISFESGSALERIGYGAFSGCTALRTVNLPARQIKIGPSAFFNTAKLESVNLESVAELGDFAFEGSALSTANLLLNGVKIGAGAFYGSTSIRTVNLGAGAVIGDYAFSDSSVTTVTIDGKGAVIGEGAFFACTRLSSFDFEDITGRVGDFAFYGCTSLTGVNAPEITELGEGCFADCFSLASFHAAKLETVGSYAFSPYAEESENGAAIKVFDAPNLKKIGDYAFYACYYLETIDLSDVSEIGSTAFALCYSLKGVTLSEELTVLPELVFYGCSSLKLTDLSHIVRFGTGCVYGVKLPQHLELTSAEYIDMQAFVVSSEEITSDIETVYAPNLLFLGEQAFAGCENLRSLVAPKLEEIGYAALGYTGIIELEITENLKKVDTSILEGSVSFRGFYATVNGEKTYDAEFDNVMIKEGVLYGITPVGYMLLYYPTAKPETVFTVADGTVRIEYCAALGNNNLETVILPESVRYIANHAFYQCANLKKVVFKSYYAPVLEGTMTGNEVKITPETIKDYPGFEKLYKYDYYFKVESLVAAPLYYSHFVDLVTSKGAEGLTYVIPKNSEGYDSRLYSAYFTPVEGEDAGTVMGAAGIAFIDAVKKLPETATRFDEALISNAINAYNVLVASSDVELVDESYVTRFTVARSQYNVSVAENKIAHLYDMANAKYFYDLVKDARAAYLALTDEERAAVSNSEHLEQKIAELASAMDKELDFTLEYADYFPVSEEPDRPEPPIAPDTEGGLDTWVIVVIAVAGVLVLGGGAFGAFLLVRKKKGVTDPATDTDKKED
ncbi:MAG: leucine-rich repeat protein [Clostridia bacterium]|nr:leucine-rich repeat protein [Clostridia bacterium]